jgi:dihydropteroate synthase
VTAQEELRRVLPVVRELRRLHPAALLSVNLEGRGGRAGAERGRCSVNCRGWWGWGRPWWSACRARDSSARSPASRAEERVAATLGACIMALARGARIFRVHDVSAARQALDVAWSIACAGEVD